MFLVYLAPGSSGEGLLTEETLKDTLAQVMTEEQAEAVGFSGMPADPEGRERRFIVVAQGDSRRVMGQLEMNPQVAQFSVHDITLG